MEDEEEQRLWRELTMERVMRSMDAALIWHIISLPKQSSPDKTFKYENINDTYSTDDRRYSRTISNIPLKNCQQFY
jgi:hypothetical protein